MKSTAINILLSLAIALMAMANDLPDILTSAAATVTVTEPVCMGACVGQVTPLSVANAMASASDASALATLIANMQLDANGGGNGGVADPQSSESTTTVTTVTSATNCPAPPTFDLSPALSTGILSGDVNGTSDDNNIDVNGTDALEQRWSQGRSSLCFTTSTIVMSGGYAIYLDGWGRDTERCGKGALDNLRGQCGDVQHWECKHWGNNGVVLTFYLGTAWRAKCVLDAMWLASPHDKREEGLCCVYIGVPNIITFNTC